MSKSSAVPSRAFAWRRLPVRIDVASTLLLGLAASGALAQVVLVRS